MSHFPYARTRRMNKSFSNNMHPAPRITPLPGLSLTRLLATLLLAAVIGWAASGR